MRRTALTCSALLLALAGCRAPAPRDPAAAVAAHGRALAAAASADEQVASLRALGELGTEACLAPILPCLRGDRPEVRRAAHEALCRVPGPAATAAIAAALRSAPPAYQPMLLRALGARRHTDSVDAIVAAATSRDPAIVLAALQALADLADPAGLAVARMQVEQGRSPAVREVAVRARLRMGAALVAEGRSDEALAVFEHALRHAGSDASRVEAVTGMAVVGGGRVLPDLLRLLAQSQGDLHEALADTCVALADRIEPREPEPALAAWRQVAAGPATSPAARLARRRLLDRAPEEKP